MKLDLHVNFRTGDNSKVAEGGFGLIAKGLSSWEIDLQLGFRCINCAKTAQVDTCETHG